MPQPDLSELQRFIDKHQDAEEGIDAVIKQINAANKTGDWVFWIMPQYKDIASDPSEDSTQYSIKSIEEAQAYWGNATLRKNSTLFINALMNVAKSNENALDEIFSDVDKKRLHAHLTLFNEVTAGVAPFGQALTELFNGEKHSKTLQLIERERDLPVFETLTYHSDNDRDECLKFNQENLVFVFGSNLDGAHGGGAAGRAARDFGAEWNKAVGPQGRSYAIPTLKKSGGALPLEQNQLKLNEIEKYAKDFIKYAKAHPELTFFVTRIGGEIAGFSNEQIAKFFIDAPTNCSMPEPWRDVINQERKKKADRLGIGYEPDRIPPKPIKEITLTDASGQTPKGYIFKAVKDAAERWVALGIDHGVMERHAQAVADSAIKIDEKNKATIFKPIEESVIWQIVATTIDRLKNGDVNALTDFGNRYEAVIKAAIDPNAKTQSTGVTSLLNTQNSAQPSPSNNTPSPPAVTANLRGNKSPLNKNYPSDFERKYRRDNEGRFYKIDASESSTPTFVDRGSSIDVLENNEDVVRDIVALAKVREATEITVKGPDVTPEIAAMYWREGQLQGVVANIFIKGKKWEPSKELRNRVALEKKSTEASIAQTVTATDEATALTEARKEESPVDENATTVDEIKESFTSALDRYKQGSVQHDSVKALQTHFDAELHNIVVAHKAAIEELKRLDTPINFYNEGEEYYEFANFSPHPVTLDDKTAPTAEHLYQAGKFSLNSQQYNAFFDPENAAARQAFNLGQQKENRLEKRDSMGDMVEIVRAKVAQHPDVAKALQNTGSRLIQERAFTVDSGGVDAFFGIMGDGMPAQEGQGKGLLGAIWMMVREEHQVPPAPPFMPTKEMVDAVIKGIGADKYKWDVPIGTSEATYRKIVEAQLSATPWTSTIGQGLGHHIPWKEMAEIHKAAAQVRIDAIYQQKATELVSQTNTRLNQINATGAIAPLESTSQQNTTTNEPVTPTLNPHGNLIQQLTQGLSMQATAINKLIMSTTPQSNELTSEFRAAVSNGKKKIAQIKQNHKLTEGEIKTNMQALQDSFATIYAKAAVDYALKNPISPGNDSRPSAGPLILVGEAVIKSTSNGEIRLSPAALCQFGHLLYENHKAQSAGQPPIPIRISMEDKQTFTGQVTCGDGESSHCLVSVGSNNTYRLLNRDEEAAHAIAGDFIKKVKGEVSLYNDAHHKVSIQRDATGKQQLGVAPIALSTASAIRLK